MGPSMADADARQPRVEGGEEEREGLTVRQRDRERDLDTETETETERGSSPTLLQVQRERRMQT